MLTVPLRRLIVSAGIVAAAVACPDAPAASSPEQQLASRYAPVVALKKQRRLCRKGEAYRPVLVDVVLGRNDVSLFEAQGEGTVGYAALQRRPTWLRRCPGLRARARASQRHPRGDLGSRLPRRTRSRGSPDRARRRGRHLLGHGPLLRSGRDPARRRPDSGSGRPAGEAREAGFWGATWAGLAFLWRDRVLRSVAVLAALLIGLWLPVEGVILPVYFQERGAPGQLGVVLDGAERRRRARRARVRGDRARFRRRIAYVGAMAGTSLAVVGMAFLPPLLGLLVFGFAAGVGLITSVSYAAGPAGYLVAGPLINSIGLQAAFLLFAGGS